MIKLINIVDRIDFVNFGIWNAAIFTAEYLQKNYNCDSELWFPHSEQMPDNEIFKNCKPLILKTTDSNQISQLIKKENLDKSNTIIITHGCWRFPTRFGFEFQKQGFIWIYVPHGMLEPWSLNHKCLQKFIYLHLFEKKMVQKAQIIRAVGSPEYYNLSKLFKYLVLIPNGVEISTKSEISKKTESICNILFMARLHHKKSVTEMLNGFINSKLFKNKNYQLIIAGADDGELINIQNILNKYLNQNININYVGFVKGEEKKELLNKSTFFVLPSKSEGFPTSLLETMQYGLIPIYTEGCNFPELIENKLGILTKPTIEDLKNTFDQIPLYQTETNIQEHSEKCSLFINNNYSSEIIAKQQFNLYKKLLNI